MSAEQLRPGWRRVRFGDVVRNVNATTKDPANDGLQRVVGLDHLDPESLILRRWDELADLPDGTSFTRVFRAGQVLFGKRRAYQRKVAVPDFDGICSGDILVFEPSSPTLLPEFLPYVVQSDGFFEHALGTSAGSLSPRTKWQELAQYEFALPPTSEQKRIVEVLDAATSVAEQHNRASELAVILRSILGEQAGTQTPLGQLLKSCDYGISVQASDSGEVPMLRMNNITPNGELDLSDLKYVPRSSVSEDDFIKAGDILFNRTNSVDHVGKLAIVGEDLDHMVFASYLLRLRVDCGMAVPEYVCAYLQSAGGQRQIRGYVSRGVSQANVNATNLKKVQVPLRPLEDQRSAAERWTAVRQLQAAADRQLAATRQLTGTLRRRLLDGAGR